MKILHIAGWSGSGKTTFIQELCGHLQTLGKTATIKHIGSHYSTLPVGKDTTLHFEAGADPAVGIDEEKTIASFHMANLSFSLNFLSDAGVKYAIIEGFKKEPFQKVLIGEMDCNPLLKDPDVPEVIEMLDQFDDWYTLSGLSKELSVQFPEDTLVTWTGHTGDYLGASEHCMRIERALSQESGIHGIRLRVQRWSDDSRFPVYLVISTPIPENVLPILSKAISRLSPCLIPGVQDG